MKQIVKKYRFEPVNGILFDLGMSSWHLEKSGRGFSFQNDEPLIMSYAHNEKSKIKSQKSKIQIKNKKYFLTAEEIVNKWSREAIERILREYGQERFAKRIAKKIVEERKIKPIKSTFQLVEIVKRAIPKRYQRQKIHPATRTFQALRIAVNDELENFKKGLSQSLEILEKGGRIVTISFHSLEDRICKNFFKEQNQKGLLKILTKKPITPSSQEIQKNPRASSAKLRAVEKL